MMILLFPQLFLASQSLVFLMPLGLFSILYVQYVVVQLLSQPISGLEPLSHSLHFSQLCWHHKLAVFACQCELLFHCLQLFLNVAIKPRLSLGNSHLPQEGDEPPQGGDSDPNEDEVVCSRHSSLCGDQVSSI